MPGALRQVDGQPLGRVVVVHIPGNGAGHAAHGVHQAGQSLRADDHRGVHTGTGQLGDQLRRRLQRRVGGKGASAGRLGRPLRLSEVGIPRDTQDIQGRPVIVACHQQHRVAAQLRRILRSAQDQDVLDLPVCSDALRRVRGDLRAAEAAGEHHRAADRQARQRRPDPAAAPAGAQDALQPVPQGPGIIRDVRGGCRSPDGPGCIQ